MTEMKRINITVWDFLDRDIKALNKHTINVSHVCRLALDKEVLSRKIVDADPDTWKKCLEDSLDEFDDEKQMEGFLSAKSHIKKGILYPSVCYYMYKVFKKYIETGNNNMWWYDLCKSSVSSESLIQAMFSDSGQDKDEDLPVYYEEDSDGNPKPVPNSYGPIKNLYAYFQDVFKAEKQMSDEEADNYRSYNGNGDWLIGYYHYVYYIFSLMTNDFEHDQRTSKETGKKLFSSWEK